MAVKASIIHRRRPTTQEPRAKDTMPPMKRRTRKTLNQNLLELLST